MVHWGYTARKDKIYGCAEAVMGYIMDLRAFVGHRPLIQVGASVILEDGQGRILLQLRQDNHRWCFSAAGSMELGESAEETARRELLEETGLTANKLELVGVYSGAEEHAVYPNGDEVYNVEFLFVCRDWSGTLTPQEDEVDGLRFFPPDQLPSNLSNGLQRRLPDWNRYREALEKS